MTSLPLLVSGQTVQYPFKCSIKQTVDTVAFLDGSEQRSPASRLLHEWTIQLGMIDENELSAIESFVIEQQGEAGQFAFTDPVDGSVYSNCSLAIEVLRETYVGPGRVSTLLIIRENPE